MTTMGSAIVRNVAIALAAGAAISGLRGGPVRWLEFSLIALWPSFGGHFVELWFLNWLRPRLRPIRGTQAAARLGLWYLAGNMLLGLMTLSGSALFGFHMPSWMRFGANGVIFIGVELLAHLALLLSGRPSFYDGRG